MIKGRTFPKVVDGSFLKCVMDCPRRAYYNHVLNLQPDRPRPPLDFGGAFHKAIEWWYKSGKPDTEYEKRIACEIFRRDYDYDGEDRRTPEIGVERLMEYMEEYKSESYDTLQVEIGFALPLFSKDEVEDEDLQDIVWGGRIDRIVDWDDEVMVFDTKTTSWLGSNYMKDWRMGLSLTGYMWGAEQLYGERIRSAVIDAISTGKNPKNPFLRDITNRGAWEFHEFKVTVADVLDRWRWRMNRYYDDENPLMVFPKHNKRWTCKFCDYVKLCKSKASKHIMDTHYVVDRWVPFRTEKVMDRTLPLRMEYT